MDKAPSPSSLRDQDRVAPTGQMPIKRDNFGDRDQPLSPGDERIFSANSSTDAAIHGPSRDVSERPQSFGGDLTIVPPFNAYASHEQSLVYGGFGNNNSTWDGYPQYFSAADGLHLSPVIYNDNPSLLYHPHYGFNPEVAYGQYSPVATPMPSIMFEGQMYTPHQIPFSPSMYPQPGAQNISSSVPLSPTELMAAEGTGESMFFGPGSGYLMHYGTYGGGNVAGNTAGSSPITTPGAYPQPMGILGPYEHHVGQQRQSHEYGVTSNSSAGHHQRGSFSGTPVSYSDGNDGIRLALERGRRRDRDQDSVYSSGDYPGFDRNRGPRASKPKGKGTSGQSSPGNDKDNSSSSDIQFELYNRTDFPSDYKQAKFFIIKSFSEDNVHKSIKYNVWASTPHGNKKLDTAYHELKEIDVNCPIFFFFSVNASGQFCGVAEMIGPVDFEKNADHWQQDRWSGQFPVQWHIIKDVPNSRFRHILLENNDNKPVTHSRDCQEVKLWQGIEMLKIFKDHDAYTSILDDFNFYDLRERASKDRKLKQLAGSRIDGPGFLVNETINQMSGSFAQALRLDDSSKELAASKPVVISKPASVVPSNDQNAAISISNSESTILVSRAEDSSNNTISLSRPFDPEEENKVLAAEKISGHPD